MFFQLATPLIRNIFCFHDSIGDSTRGRLGSGNVNFQRIFTSLKSINYQGPIVYESFSREAIADLSAVIEALAVWRTSWKPHEAEAIAKHARKFICEQMETSNLQ